MCVIKCHNSFCHLYPGKPPHDKRWWKRNQDSVSDFQAQKYKLIGWGDGSVNKRFATQG